MQGTETGTGCHPRAGQTPEHDTCVILGALRATRTTLNSAEGLGLPQSCRSARGSSGFAQAWLRLGSGSGSATTRSDLAENTPCWWQGEPGTGEAALDCHSELGRAQPWQEEQPFPSCAPGARSTGDTASPALLSHLRASCPGEPCQGSVPSLGMLHKALCPLWGQHGQKGSSFWGETIPGAQVVQTERGRKA